MSYFVTVGRMVGDRMCQHLICWNVAGNSFIVTNVTEFAKQVLPKRKFSFYSTKKASKTDGQPQY